MRLTSSELRRVADQLDQLAQIGVRVKEFTLTGADTTVYEVELGYLGQRNEDPTYYLTGVREGTARGYSASADPSYPYS